MNKISKNEQLSLDNIMMLQINGNYMITILGIDEINYNERVLLSSGKKEIIEIRHCLNNNYELERKSITAYMPSDYIGIYNEALNMEKYDICLKMLYGLEKYLNEINKERNELLLKVKRGK